MKTKWIIASTLVGASAVAMLGGAVFMLSGIYDMAAIHPHSPVVRSLLLTVKRNSVEFHARDLEVPEVHQPELIERGFVLYRRNCVTCHGAPGEARSRVGRGLNPNPPPLETAVENWTSAEIAWITTHGLKMAGMPGFALGEHPDDLWAITAFIERMHTLTPAEYRAMDAAAKGDIASEKVQWLPPDPGWRELAERGDSELGKELIRGFGCGTCHIIPGIGGANGTVGPPLTEWAKRHYIAGTRINQPNSLVRWIMDPQNVEPGTVMPDLGVSDEAAWNIAAYLYSLGFDGERPGATVAE